MNSSEEKQQKVHEQKSSRPDELIVNMLSDTLFLLQNDVTKGIKGNKELISSMSETLADITRREWKKLLQKEDIKIQTELDPEVLLIIYSISEKLKSNTDALNNLADKLEKSLKDIQYELNGLNKKYDNSNRETVCKTEEKQEIKKKKNIFNKQKIKKTMLILLPFAGAILFGVAIGKFF